MYNAPGLDDKGNGRRSSIGPEGSPLRSLAGFEEVSLTSMYPRGAVVFAQGQRCEGVYLLRSGRAKVLLSSSEGKTLILRLAHAGALLGVNSVLKNIPYDVSVETLESSQIDCVSRSDFMRILEKSAASSAEVAHLLADELSDMFEQVRSLLLSQTAAEKLARLLLRWRNGDKEGQTESRIKLGLTHEEIAQLICASRETVTRLFAELRRKQIISFAGNTIVVSDRNALESMAWQRGTEESSPR